MTPREISNRMNESGPDDRLLSPDVCAKHIQRIFRMCRNVGEIDVGMASWWTGEVRWARNRMTTVADRRDIQLSVSRRIAGSLGTAHTNQLDDVSLDATVRTAEQDAEQFAEIAFDDLSIQPPALPMPTPIIWSDATFGAAIESRSKIAHLLQQGAAAKGMLAAGYLEVRGGSTIRITINADVQTQINALPPVEGVRRIQEMMAYAPYTQAQCSMTVRHPKGLGSGWAGISDFDWAQIDAAALAQRALDRCLQSMNSVRIEPGRYTVILEPQAVADLLDILMMDGGQHGEPLNRTAAESESGAGPFYLGPDQALRIHRSRVGLRVIDDRITIDHDPSHARLGTVPKPGLTPIAWIKNGVLQTLSYERDYAVVDLNDNTPELARPAYRMSGGETSIEQMITTTKRGLLVTRFSNLTMLDSDSLLATGVTRDGLWLIENGRTTKAVKNMRITESPLFVLNNVDQLGVPVPVFRPVRNPFDMQLTPAMVPPVKANDFSFTSTIDAI